MRTGYLLLALSLLVCAADADASGKRGKRGRDVTVDCDRGRTIARALERRDEVLTIHVSGTCAEDVVIRRGNVTIRGVDGATLQGSITVDPNDPTQRDPNPGPVWLRELDIVGSSDVGLRVLAGARVTALDLRVSGAAASGIAVRDGGRLHCVDCESSNNGDAGLTVLSTGSAQVEGDGIFDGNATSGIGVGSNGDVTIGNLDPNDPSPMTVSTSGNLEHGIVAFAGGNVLVDVEATIEANGNGSGPGAGNFGAGFLIGTGASGFMSGTVNAAGNDAGIFAIAGALLMFGNANVTGNQFGMFVQNEGILRPTGTNTVTGNVLGIFMQGGLLQLGPTSFSGNANDLNLQFGAKVRYPSAQPGLIVFCDGTVLTQAPFSCP